MKFTKKIMTMATCAVMAASSMVGAMSASAATDDYGNTTSTAYTVTTSGCYGTINYSGDVDMFAFTPSTSGLYYFYTTGSTNTTGTLYNSSGSSVASATEGFADDTNFAIGYELTAGSKYYIAVKAPSNVTGGYQINVGWASLLARVSRLAQSDSRWGSIKLGLNDSNPTIASQGCALTSFTMVTNFWNNTSSTPANVNTTMGSAAYPFDWSTAATRYFGGVTPYRQGSDSNPITTSSGITYTRQQLKLGRPVIIGMYSPTTTHFVVAVGYYNGEIYIIDPAARNYTKLSQYTNTGYSIYEILAYHK